MHHILAVGAAVFLSVVARVHAQQVTGDDQSSRAPDAAAKTVAQFGLIVHPVRNVQPQQVAEALQNAFPEDRRITTVEVSPGGVLLVRASSEARKEVQEFLEVFDSAPRVADLQLLLLRAGEKSEGLPPISALCGRIEAVLETIARGEADKRLMVVDRVEASALEHATTDVLRYYHTPVIGGLINPMTGTVKDTVRNAETGMSVKIVTDVDEDGKISLELGFAAIEFTGEVRADTPGTEGTILAKTTVQKTLQLGDGHATAVSVGFDNGSGTSRSAVLVVAARVRAAQK